MEGREFENFLLRWEQFKKEHMEEMKQCVNHLKWIWTEFHPIVRPNVKVLRGYCNHHVKRYVDNIDVTLLANILYHCLYKESHADWDVDIVLTRYLKAHLQRGLYSNE